MIPNQTRKSRIETGGGNFPERGQDAQGKNPFWGISRKGKETRKKTGDLVRTKLLNVKKKRRGKERKNKKKIRINGEGMALVR